MSWFETGDENLKKKSSGNSSRSGGGKGKIYRVFVESGAQNAKNIIFLDSYRWKRKITVGGQEKEISCTPFIANEAKCTIDNDFRNYLTSVKGTNQKCYLEENGYAINKMRYFTVLVEFKPGEWVKNLYVLKYNPYLNFKSIIDTHPKIKGDPYLWKFQISRATNRDATTGNNIIPIEQMTPQEVELLLPDGEDIKPFNYMQILKPLPYETMEQMASEGRLKKDKFASANNTGGKNSRNRHQQQGFDIGNSFEEAPF